MRRSVVVKVTIKDYQYVAYELLPSSKLTNSLAMMRSVCSLLCSESYHMNESQHAASVQIPLETVQIPFAYAVVL